MHQSTETEIILVCVISKEYLVILLQTWKVASQQCESYGWEESFTGKYGMTSSSHVWLPDLGDKFGDEIWYLKGAGIFSIFLLGEKIRHECARSFHVTSRPAWENYIRRALGRRRVLLIALERERLWSPIRFAS
ncbi:hypothetical protein AVEN_158765-1 [Araneus ventricosus]|uniref:Uncharacterized protein n=1 Tax=Araneus ventricosus TaxID=182803 RepID=A0A4Y2MIU0_ARAVE|nr:hypothetical protein AVEN_158765-1 [Araneus ventricosus]